MKNQLVPAVMFTFIAFTHGCDGTPVDKSPYCETRWDAICEPPGFPFVAAVASRSDACPGAGDCSTPLTATTTVMTQPEPGKVCMSGTVAGRDGFAWLIVGVSEWNQWGTHIADVFDAKSLGIEQVRFTVDTPPVTGITMFATSAHRRTCSVPSECLNGFNLHTAPRSGNLKVIDQTETITAPFTTFANDDPNMALDASQLAHFIFVLGAGDYDFCLSGLTFLDATGNVVPAP
jgi:hypothetical protein